MSFRKTYQEALQSYKPLARRTPLRRTGFKSKSVSTSEEGNTLQEQKAGKGKSNAEVYAEIVASRSTKKPRKRMRGVRIDPADKYFSLYIRYRDNWLCQRCLTQYAPVTNALHASHFWGRARESTRFDPVNVAAHCHGCHSFLTANPEEHRVWKLKQIGQEEYDKLMLRAHATAQKDRKLTTIIFKKLYHEEKLRYEEKQ